MHLPRSKAAANRLIHSDAVVATAAFAGVERGDPSLLVGLNVLLVDDDADSRDLAQRVLEAAGANVRTASSAEEGFKLLMEFRPDVLISDISMPEQDGYTFMRKVRSCGSWCSDLPCIALTALARPEDRERALQAGYDEHMAKPFDASALGTMLSNLVAGRARAASHRSVGHATPVENTGAEATTSSEASSEAKPNEARSQPIAAGILLVEDSEAIAEMLRIVLESAGFQVEVTASVAEAIAAAGQHRFDLLISDLRLPDGTGWDMMRQIQVTRPIPGIVLSGYSDEAYVNESRAAGFSEYLVKPVEDEQLLSAVRNLLGEK